MQIKIKERHHFTLPRIATVTEHRSITVQREKITGIGGKIADYIHKRDHKRYRH